MRGMPMIGEFVGGESAAFHAFNRNKRAITADLKHPEARRALLDLAKECDVVAENFRAGVMDRLGFGYEDFKAVKPDIIYASGSGWGQRTEMAKQNRPGQDLLIQAMCGLMYNTGRATDPPTAAGTPVADFAAAQAMVSGILAALIARDRLGIGQRVEVDLYSATLNLQAQENFAVLNQGIDLKRSEAGVASCWNDAPYGTYPSSDGWMAIAMCPLDKLGGLIGDDALADLDPWTERDEVKRRIEAQTRQRSTADWMGVFEAADVWSAPVRTSRQAMDELVEMESDRLITLDHPKGGPLKMIACPITLSETPAVINNAAPLVGEHTDEVLVSLLGAERVASLRKDGAI
jgi:crotonobetainyl-CoA:carnitine CoA-transferase CaiB-like acyl-CoA transferase